MPIIPRSIILLLISLTAVSVCTAQISGIVKDDQGTALPYVNIHIEGTTQGTTTNVDGEYILQLTDADRHVILYQYVGYETLRQTIDHADQPQTLDVSLQQATYSLNQVIVSADAEDPAYAIIRKAQAKRKYYKSKMDNFSCDAYVKGFNEIVKVPSSKLLKIELGTLEDNLNEDGTGVIYLSESISRIYKKGGKSKEVMYSSKVSGNDRGYSFNSGKEMDFNFYENTLELNRQIVSPIAWNALSHYDYELEGTHYEGSTAINKIKVIPKNPYGNTFYGHIFINDNLWNIHSLKLGVTREATQLPFVDSLTFNQIYLPAEPDRWMLMSNVINFNLSALGFDVRGNFAAVFSNYELDKISDKEFDSVVFKVEEEANQRSESYWSDIRPLPLTKAEVKDYKVKDSIKLIKESPAYLDSIDGVRNKFKLSNLLSGYTYNNSHKGTAFTIPSLILGTSLNSVQGWNTNLALDWTKSKRESRTKRITIRAVTNYGFSDKQLRQRLRFTYRDRAGSSPRYNLELGRKASQFSRLEPISPFINSFFTLVHRQNYMKLYDQDFISVRHSRYLTTGIRGTISLDYEDRSPLVNSYFGGLNQEERDFSSNNPTAPNDDQPAFDPHKALILRAHVLINPGQKAWVYPDRTFREDSEWPTFGLFYKGGLDIDGGRATYDLIYGTIEKTMTLSVVGTTRTYAMAGTFLGEGPEQFIDHFHFIGNQTYVVNTSDHHRRFLMLPYYEMSSAESFAQVHLEHNFNGYVLSKIPGLKRTEWQLTAGYKFLYTSDQGSYDEWIIGFENFGVKLFRLLRVDLVWHKRFPADNEPDTSRKLGLVVGSKIRF